MWTHVNGLLILIRGIRMRAPVPISGIILESLRFHLGIDDVIRRRLQLLWVRETHWASRRVSGPGRLGIKGCCLPSRQNRISDSDEEVFPGFRIIVSRGYEYPILQAQHRWYQPHARAKSWQEDSGQVYPDSIVARRPYAYLVVPILWQNQPRHDSWVTWYLRPEYWVLNDLMGTGGCELMWMTPTE